MSRLVRVVKKEEDYIDVVISLTPDQIVLLDKKAKDYDCSRSKVIGLILSECSIRKPLTLSEVYDKILDMHVDIQRYWDEHRNETINLVKDVIARSNGK